MAESHLVSGLKNLRAEKLGRLQQIKAEIERLEAEAASVEAVVGHVDGVLKDVAPELDLETVKPVRARRPTQVNGHDGSGHALPVTQHILRIMRLEKQPMAIDEIVECLAVQRPGSDRKKLSSSAYQFLGVKVKDGLLLRHDLQDGRKAFSINR